MWEGGVTDEKGGPGKGGGQDPLTPPPPDTPMNVPLSSIDTVTFKLFCQR